MGPKRCWKIYHSVRQVEMLHGYIMKRGRQVYSVSYKIDDSKKEGVKLILTQLKECNERVANYIEHSGLTDNVVRFKTLTPEKMLDLYRLSDVVVLFSYSEGTPLVLVEAASQGTAIVAIDVGADDDVDAVITFDSISCNVVTH